MSLDLDERQRAILQEMGVHVWQPLPEAVTLPAAAPALAATPTQGTINAIKSEATSALDTGAKVNISSETRQQPSTTGGARESAPGLAEGIDDMDWPQLVQAVTHCQACLLCKGRRAPVFGANSDTSLHPIQADWFIVGEPPDEAEERQGAPFAEQAGQLLDNMLRAVGARRGGAGHSGATAAYVSNVVKCRPALVRNPSAQEMALCEHYLRREVALVQPKVILALGRFAAHCLLRENVPDVAGIPLGKLRGQVYRYQGVPVVVSYHPAYLLRTQSDKARAWADLCLARSLLRPPVAP